MRSWKARLLMLLTTIAMILAVSVPVIAQADDCIGVGTDNGGDNCIGVGSADTGGCSSNDLNLDSFDNEDSDLNGIDDNCDDNGDVIDDVEVSDPFLDGDQICVDATTTFNDGTSDTERECDDSNNAV